MLRCLYHLARGLIVVVRLFLAAVFILSALGKIQYPYDFLWSVYDYELVGRTAGVFVAWCIPWLELVVGVMLVGGVMQCGASLLALILLASFTFAKLSVLARGLRIPCGCFGRPSAEMVDAREVVITGLLLAGAATVLLFAVFASRRRSALLER